MEYKCVKCNGCGNMSTTVDTIEVLIEGFIHKFPGRINSIKCDKCNGKGYLDWIENVIGCGKELDWMDEQYEMKFVREKKIGS
jgi:hypothetical protein